jgi:hypothetical protein
MEVTVEDKSSQLAVKDAILARSGIYIYSHDEVVKMGLTPKTNKPLYREYRPAGVMIESKDKFNMVPVPKDHPPVDITPDNFHQYASGITGNVIDFVKLPDGEIGLKGQIAFFTRDAYDHYMAGHKETSAGYSKTVMYADDPEKDGYDWIMTGITAVNHVAVLSQGRGGNNVRVLDNKAVETKINGGSGMAKIGSFLSTVFGIGKTEDANFKFSAVLMASVAKVHSLDQTGMDKEVAGVMSHVTSLGESEAREVLIGAVTDCFKHPVEVIAKKDAVAEKIDELYAKCQAADADVVNRILDAKQEPEKKKEKENTETESKDTAAMIDAAVQKAFTTVAASLDAKIEASVKKALGVDDGADAKAKDGRTVTTDGTDVANTDATWLLRGAFGQRG